MFLQFVSAYVKDVSCCSIKAIRSVIQWLPLGSHPRRPKILVIRDSIVRTLTQPRHLSIICRAVQFNRRAYLPLHTILDPPISDGLAIGLLKCFYADWKLISSYLWPIVGDMKSLRAGLYGERLKLSGAFALGAVCGGWILAQVKRPDRASRGYVVSLSHE